MGGEGSLALVLEAEKWRGFGGVVLWSRVERAGKGPGGGEGMAARGRGERVRTVHFLEDSVYGAGAAAAGHGDVEFVMVLGNGHFGGAIVLFDFGGMENFF